MEIVIHCLGQAVRSVHRERRRLYPMALGIVWGMASVMVLLAVTGGFEESQRKALGAYGERFVYLRLNRAELDRAAGSTERRIHMYPSDLGRLREGAPAIVRLTPMNMAYRARITGRSGAGVNTFVAGVLPEITRIRNLPLAEGRFFNELDEAERRRVIVLGPMVRKQLFGARQAVGRTVRIAGFSTAMIPGREPAAQAEALGRRNDRVRPRDADPGLAARSAQVRRTVDKLARNGVQRQGILGETFTVIGVLKDVEIQRESYASVARMAFVPFSTSCAVFDRDFSSMLIEPRSPEEKDLALHQFRTVMGARYGFEPDDRNAVVIYFDSIDRALRISAVFRGIRAFLAIVGVLILGIGAIGVMNVVLVSVAARRFEIGLRKALGATPLMIYGQFFVETLLACFVSGTLGFILGGAGIALLQGLPLPEGFSRPVLDLQVAAYSFALLAAVAVLVAFYPARRAALLPPVEALKQG